MIRLALVALLLSTSPLMALDFASTTGKRVKESPANTFHIPACTRGKLGYVVASWPEPMFGTVMRIHYTITASPDAQIVGYEHRDQAGRLALYFQRDGMDYGQAKYDLGYRWWSRARQVLTPGDHSFEVLIELDKWTGGGTQAQAHFDAARNDLNGVGFTLSDNQSAGHGVCMKAGTAKLTVKAFTIHG
jgi:hypothetical protein